MPAPIKLFGYPGSKSQMLPLLKSMLPDPEFYKPELYAELFFGSGVLFFNTKRWDTVNYLNDADWFLMNIYKCVLERYSELIESINERWKPNTRANYEMWRNEFNITRHNEFRVKTATLWLLLATCTFNDIYRVNDGKWEGSWDMGSAKTNADDIINKVDAILNRLKAPETFLMNDDYLYVINHIYHHDHYELRKFFFFDPPYDAVIMKGIYNNKKVVNFDIEGLGKICEFINERGDKFMATNFDTPAVRNAFNHPQFHIYSIPNTLQNRRKGDKVLNEIIITNYNKFAGLPFEQVKLDL